MAEEAGLVAFLFFGNVNRRKFVDCTEGNKLLIRRRWLIFLSILAQKFLQSVSKPLASFGSALEQWLDLLSRNRNIYLLFLDFTRGTSLFLRISYLANNHVSSRSCFQFFSLLCLSSETFFLFFFFGYSFIVKYFLRWKPLLSLCMLVFDL